MRLREFIENAQGDESKTLQFDMVDDVVAYMRNDPELYRRVVFPALDGKSASRFKKLLMPHMEKIISMYLEKFDIQDIDKDTDLDTRIFNAILRKLHDAESEDQ